MAVYDKNGRLIRSSYITSTRGEESDLFREFRKALVDTGHFTRGVGGASWSYFQMDYFEEAPGGIRKRCGINLTFDVDTNKKYLGLRIINNNSNSGNGVETWHNYGKYAMRITEVKFYYNE